MSIFCGGYYIMRTAPRAEHMSAELLPDNVLSISECICGFVSADWAVEWVHTRREERAVAARTLGLDTNAFGRACAWATQALENGDFGWPNVFPTLETAHWFRSEFFPESTAIKLVGIGLSEDYVDEFIEEFAPCRGQGDSGTFTALSLRCPLATGGRTLGYEILGLDIGSFHSAVCNGLEKDFANELGVVPNAEGFITDEGDARRCSDYAGLETTGAEPGLWLPWQVVLY